MKVSKCLREGCQASRIEEAYHKRGQVGGQISMGPCESRGTGVRELRWLTPLLHKAKDVLKGRVRGPAREHLFLKNDRDHRRMHVIEQVRSKVKRNSRN